MSIARWNLKEADDEIQVLTNRNQIPRLVVLVNLAMDREANTQTKEPLVNLAGLGEEAMSYLGRSLAVSGIFFLDNHYRDVVEAVGEVSRRHSTQLF